MLSTQWTAGWDSRIAELRRRLLDPTDTNRPDYRGVVADTAKMLRLTGLALVLRPHGVVAAINVDYFTSCGGKPVGK